MDGNLTYTDFEIFCSIPDGFHEESVIDCVVDMLDDTLTNTYELSYVIYADSAGTITISILNDPQWLRYKLTNPTILEDEVISMEYMEAKLYPTGHHEITTTILLEWERIS